jgi:hypothetical protein
MAILASMLTQSASTSVIWAEPAGPRPQISSLCLWHPCRRSHCKCGSSPGFVTHRGVVGRRLSTLYVQNGGFRAAFGHGGCPIGPTSKASAICTSEQEDLEGDETQQKTGDCSRFNKNLSQIPVTRHIPHPIVVRKLPARATFTAFQFDLVDGKRQDLGTVTAEGAGSIRVEPQPGRNDWILVLDSTR